MPKYLIILHLSRNASDSARTIRQAPTMRKDVVCQDATLDLAALTLTGHECLMPLPIAGAQVVTRAVAAPQRPATASTDADKLTARVIAEEQK